MNRLTIAALALVPAFAAVTPISFQSAAIAQDQSGPVCMNSGARRSSTGESLTIVVSSARKSEMEAKGYVAERCSGKENSVAQFRAQICGLAATAPQPVKISFEQTYGVTPDRLCALASEI